VLLDDARTQICTLLTCVVISIKVRIHYRCLGPVFTDAQSTLLVNTGRLHACALSTLLGP